MAQYYSGSMSFHCLFDLMADASQSQDQRSFRLSGDHPNELLIGDSGRVFIRKTIPEKSPTQLSIMRYEDGTVRTELQYDAHKIEETLQDFDMIPSYLLDPMIPWLHKIHPMCYQKSFSRLQNRPAFLVWAWYSDLYRRFHGAHAKDYPIGSAKHFALYRLGDSYYQNTAQFYNLGPGNRSFAYRIKFENMPKHKYDCYYQDRVISMDTEGLLLDQIREAPIEFYGFFHELILELDTWDQTRSTYF